MAIQFPDSPTSGTVYLHTHVDNGITIETQYRFTNDNYWLATGSSSTSTDLDSRYIRTIGDRIFGQFHSEINVSGNIDIDSRQELPEVTDDNSAP